MATSEVLMFKQYDTLDGTVPVPHTAFDAPRERNADNVPDRESCEVRVMCFFVDDENTEHHAALQKLHAAGSGVVDPKITDRWCANTPSKL